MNDRDLNRLATELFRTFARFEYALKASGFHQGDGAAEAHWRDFAVAMADAFDSPPDGKFHDAITYILEHPPKKQMVENGILKWAVVPPNTDLRSDLVLLYVRRVRNNLFHGGKFNGHWFEPERSAQLLNASLTILNGCLSVSGAVREAYRG